MAKSIQVQISLVVGQVRRLLNYGRSQRMQCNNGTLWRGTITRKIVEFMLWLYDREDVREHLEEHGGTLHDLIDRSVTQYIASKRN